MGHNYVPCLQINTQKYFQFFNLFFLMYIVTNKSQKNVFYKYFYTRAFSNIIVVMTVLTR